MSDIATFNFGAAAVRVVTVDGEPWFIAKDVLDILQYSNGRDAIASIPARMKGSVAIRDGIPGNPNRTAISESGVYRLVMRSTLPAAEHFQDWLAEDVVPSIRKTGTYGQPAELTRRDLAVMIIEEADRADTAEAQVHALAPRAEVADRILNATGDLSVGDAAKALTRAGIPTGQNRLFEHLGRMGWTYRGRGDGKWRPVQTAIETRRLSSLPQSHADPRTGEQIIDPPQVRVTPKGLQQLLAALSPQKELEPA